MHNQDVIGSLTDNQGSPSLDNIVVILSRTTEPMNIGAACRAMKTMGLKHLRLISPLNPKGRTARALAHGSEDILDNALVVEDLMDAISDCTVVVGTTARVRQLRKDSHLTPDIAAEHMMDHSRGGKVGLLFGTERSGLTNDEVDVCRYLTSVDTAPEHGSLNLAQAVMLYGWEIRKAWNSILATEKGEEKALLEKSVETQETASEETCGDSSPQPNVRRPEMRVRHPHRTTKLPTQHELDNMYGHIATVMKEVGYSDAEVLKFMTYLRQLHMRAGIVNWETHIYHIFCRKILFRLGVPKFMGIDSSLDNDEPKKGPSL
ncbi:MAG: RNA methyltransferase [bacterium]|nr:RNA methyltransferase [bacterium]